MLTKEDIARRRDLQLQEDYRDQLSTARGRRVCSRICYELGLRDLDQQEDLFAGAIKDGQGADAYRAFYIGKQSLAEAFERELRAASPTGWALMRHERDMDFIADEQALAASQAQENEGDDNG